ncbi:glutamate--cysteine ligase [Aquabacterium sp.]|uniref:glutamate--cysteine ligase n=1 Tax=Aquabacterium sp. TaxID=1872578 RepID=UPI0035C76814
MNALIDRLQRLGPAGLQGMRRGIEKEGLRVLSDGTLSHTPHPEALGSALTHPHITTDFSESQLELVTGVHARIEDCLSELRDVHRFVLRHLSDARLDECMWPCSMPGDLPADADIPVGWYGRSNVGLSKRVYRHGLVHRYGARMQTISGIHYNWSLHGATTQDYFALIRNFRRHGFILLMLFGASPAVTAGFAQGLAHGLQPLGEQTLHLPHATSLRMGRLGYQSDAQAALCVSYNDLEGYARSLQDALLRPYPAYEAIGIQDGQGEYRQLGTSLLQIENEFYSTIRPKRVTRSGERPLHALRERGVEYVEVRCMDLQPALDVGIDAHTLRVLDTFLLWAMLSDSPPDTPQEVRALSDNHRLVASQGREPGLTLRRDGRDVALADWAEEVMAQAQPVAEALDRAHGGDAFAQSWAQAREALRHPERLPSAQVLQAMRAQHGGEHAAFGLAASQRVRAQLLAEPLPTEVLAAMRQQALASLQAQRDIEALDARADALPFALYRQHYLDPASLQPGSPSSLQRQA